MIQMFPKLLKTISVLALVRLCCIYVNIGKRVYLHAVITRVGEAVCFVSSSEASDVLLCTHSL